METASIDKTNDGQKWLLYKLWTGSRGPHVNCDTDSDSVRYGMRKINFAPVLVPPEEDEERNIFWLLSWRL